MIITIVMEQYGKLNNGTTATAMRLGHNLMARGHEVRVLTSSDYDGSAGEKIYKLNQYKVPVFNTLIEKQGMIFSQPDDEIINLAIKDSDLVHIILPFNLGRRVKALCKVQNIPYTTAFHCQPENISSSIYLGKLGFVNNFIYGYLGEFYDEDDVIHCPSNMIAEQLIKHKYKSEIKVISNGITNLFTMERKEKPEAFKDKIVLVSTGRYSSEKRQDLIMNAIMKSKYKKYIVLILCGKGPKHKKLMRRANRLENSTVFKFCSQEELKEIYNYADFYIHASDAEIEGLACMEAFACGLIPLISNSKKSATSQFALNENCIFKRGSSKDLARKLDYMIEHPEELKELRKQYAESAEKYRIDKCIDQIEEMFKERIEKTKKQ